MNRIYLKLKMFCVILLLFFSNNIKAQDTRDQAIKFHGLLRLIDAFYVDTTNVKTLTEEAIVGMLKKLDPHSVYISKDEVEDMNEPLMGSFSGIGIQFNILNDTLMVVATISGGPSEKVGLRAGDRIIEIDKENIAGVGLKNSGVRKRLKGERGTEVTVKVKRKGENEPLDFLIIRDKIPIYSLDAKYMVDNRIGYIRLNRFAATTVTEFEQAMNELLKKGMKDLILDLRGNGGGFMGAAIKLVDNFLDGTKKIVYTQGKSSLQSDNYSTPGGKFLKGKIAVLIDEGSASASEIVSGAVQDWDRGIIIGRRSFGKGLVQRQFPLSDQSMVRLTVSHYYTPSGRCVQKPYDKGVDDYRLDIIKRYNSGEMVNADSIHFPDSLKYTTLRNKRIVYGGGGIMPDIFIPIDTTKNYKYFNALARKNVVNSFSAEYCDLNRDNFKKKYKTFEQFEKEFVISDKMIKNLVKKAEKEKLYVVSKNVFDIVKHLYVNKVKKDKVKTKLDEYLKEENLKISSKTKSKIIKYYKEQYFVFTKEEYKSSLHDLKKQIKALIARDTWRSGKYWKVVNKDNKFYNTAITILKDNKKYKTKLGY